MATASDEMQSAQNKCKAKVHGIASDLNMCPTSICVKAAEPARNRRKTYEVCAGGAGAANLAATSTQKTPMAPTSKAFALRTSIHG